jgi:hypothetical protein
MLKMAISKEGAEQRADKDAKEVADAIKKFAKGTHDGKFTVLDIARVIGKNDDYVRMFLHKYVSPQSSSTFVTRYNAMQKILKYEPMPGTKPVVYRYLGRKDEIIVLTPVEIQDPAKKKSTAVGDTRIIQIDYTRKKTSDERVKSVEELLVEIKNEMVVMASTMNELANTQKGILKVQEDTYKLFKEIREGKKK